MTCLHHHKWIALALLVLGAISLAACSTTAAPTAAPPTAAAQPTSPPQPTTAPAQPTAAPVQPTPAPTAGAATGKNKFYYVSPNPIGVNAFLALAKTGIEAAAKKYNAEVKTLESENDPSSREENVRAAVNDGANIVAVVGFEFSDIIPKVAKESPKVNFIIVDQCIDNPPPNVRCAVFREYEAGYLLGAEAGLLTKSNKIAAISAIDIPFLHRYTDSFTAGAQAVNPKVTTAVRWIGTDPSAFSDPAKAKEQALALAGQGYDEIFAAGAASNLGIFEAAKEKNFQTYGVDVNQCPSAAGFVVDNLLKRTDKAVELTVDSVMSGQPGGTATALGLKEGGIGIIPFAGDNPDQSQCLIMKNPDVIKQVQDLQNKIISGELKLKDPMNP